VRRLVPLAEPARRVVRVRPQLREPPVLEIQLKRRDLFVREIFLVDLTEEDTIPYLNENDLHSNHDIEIIEKIPPVPLNNLLENDLYLEPLDPDLECYQNLTRIFINLEEYARNILYDPPPS